MIFTLEALEAREGDALLLHFGKADAPELVVIDGGPTGVYKRTLKKRLEALRASRAQGEALPIRMVMVSHIDDDHIGGVLAMMEELADLRDQDNEVPYDIVTLWHNSFNDIVGDHGSSEPASIAGAARTAARGGTPAGWAAVGAEGRAILASAEQGLNLRNCAKKLSVGFNDGFNGLVMVPKGKKDKRVTLGGGLSLTVLGPIGERVDKLQAAWDKELKQKGLARTAATLRETVTNLSSIIVLAKAGKRSMLLTGDADAKDIVAGLKRAKLLATGKAHFDILKIPHHGSKRTVTKDFFKEVTADHYVISGNGQQDNPEPATLRMIVEARGLDDYTMHFTNKEPRLVKFFKKEQKSGRKFKVVYRDENKPSIRVDLADPLQD
jgi:hypothetical protein